MKKYRRLLEEVRALFPHAKTVEINVLTTNDEKIHFGSDLLDYTKDTCTVMIADGVKEIAVPCAREQAVNIQFDTLGKISVSTYETNSISPMLGETKEDSSGDRGYIEPRY